MKNILLILILVLILKLEPINYVYDSIESWIKNKWPILDQRIDFLYSKYLPFTDKNFYTSLYRASFYTSIFLAIIYLTVDFCASIAFPEIKDEALTQLVLGYINIISCTLIAFASARAVITILLFIKRIQIQRHNSYGWFVSEFAVVMIFMNFSFALDYFIAYRFLIRCFDDVKRSFFWREFADFLYYSTTTITTVGLGDIKPTSLTTRVLTTIEIFEAFALVIIIFANYSIWRTSKSEQ